MILQRAEDGSGKKHRIRWLARCDCGNEIVSRTAAFRSGDTRSCGCARRLSLQKLAAQAPRRTRVCRGCSLDFVVNRFKRTWYCTRECWKTAKRRAKDARASDPVGREQRRQKAAAASRECERSRARLEPGIHTRRAQAWRSRNPSRSRELNDTKTWTPERRARHAMNHRLWMAKHGKRESDSRKSAPGVGVTGQDWLRILELHDHRCAYCLTPGLKLTVDHVVALSRGGCHEPSNIVPACRSCNSTKNNRPIWAMLKARSAKPNEGTNVNSH